MKAASVPELSIVRRGHCLQIPYEYRGYPMWIGADYYQSDNGYVTHYKAGIEGSWLATRIDYENDAYKAHEDTLLTCAKEEIETIIQKTLQENMGQAGERHLRAAYNFVEMRGFWNENGNREYAEQFKTFQKYDPVKGIRESVYACIKMGDTNLMVFGHLDRSGTVMDLLCSYSGFEFVKVCELPVRKDDDIGQVILDAYNDERELFWDTVRAGELAASVRGITYPVETSEQVFGRLDMWND